MQLLFAKFGIYCHASRITYSVDVYIQLCKINFEQMPGVWATALCLKVELSMIWYCTTSNNTASVPAPVPDLANSTSTHGIVASACFEHLQEAPQTMVTSQSLCTARRELVDACARMLVGFSSHYSEEHRCREKKEAFFAHLAF